jgi:hypothetical protein
MRLYEVYLSCQDRHDFIEAESLQEAAKKAAEMSYDGLGLARHPKDGESWDNTGTDWEREAARISYDLYQELTTKELSSGWLTCQEMELLYDDRTLALARDYVIKTTAGIW